MLQLMDTMPDPEAMDRIRAAGLTVPGVLGIEKCFARKTGLQMARRPAPGSGPRDERLRIARDRHAGEGRRSAPIVDWVADVLVHVEPHLLGTIAVGPHGKS